MEKERWKTPLTSSWSLSTIQTSKTTSTTPTQLSRFPRTFTREASEQSLQHQVTDWLEFYWFNSWFALQPDSTGHSERAQLDSGTGESVHGEQPGGPVAAVAGLWQRHGGHPLLPRCLAPLFLLWISNLLSVCNVGYIQMLGVAQHTVILCSWFQPNIIICSLW